MSRYIERAENTARLVDVNLQLLLDFASLEDSGLTQHWEPILRSLGDYELFQALYQEPANSRNATDFLTFNPKNPSSVFSCVQGARENARSVRDQISSEMWEAMNRLHLYLRGKDTATVWAGEPYEFYATIREYSHLFQGVVAATFPRNIGYEFMEAGKYIERAGKTGRMLDTKYWILLPALADVGGAVDTAQWVALLRSCSATDAYHHKYVADVEPKRVAEFLVFDRHFPRSIAYCVNRLEEALGEMGGGFDTAERYRARYLCSALVERLQQENADVVLNTGLHEFLSDTQKRLDDIGAALSEAYMFFPVEDTAAAVRSEA